MKRILGCLAAAGMAMAPIAAQAQSAAALSIGGEASPITTGFSFFQDDDDDDGGGSTAVILGVLLVVLIGVAAAGGDSGSVSP